MFYTLSYLGGWQLELAVGCDPVPVAARPRLPLCLLGVLLQKEVEIPFLGQLVISFI